MSTSRGIRPATFGTVVALTLALIVSSPANPSFGAEGEAAISSALSGYEITFADKLGFDRADVSCGPAAGVTSSNEYLCVGTGDSALIPLGALTTLTKDRLEAPLSEEELADRDTPDAIMATRVVPAWCSSKAKSDRFNGCRNGAWAVDLIQVDSKGKVVWKGRAGGGFLTSQYVQNGSLVVVSEQTADVQYLIGSWAGSGPTMALQMKCSGRCSVISGGNGSRKLTVGSSFTVVGKVTPSIASGAFYNTSIYWSARVSYQAATPAYFSSVLFTSRCDRVLSGKGMCHAPCGSKAGRLHLDVPGVRGARSQGDQLGLAQHPSAYD